MFLPLMPWIIAAVVNTLPFALILQTEEYENYRYIEWLRTHRSFWLPRQYVILSLALVLSGGLIALVGHTELYLLVVVIAGFLACILAIQRYLTRKFKKKLAITLRMLRILVLLVALVTLLYGVIGRILDTLASNSGTTSYATAPLIAAALFLSAPLLLVGCTSALFPFEFCIRSWYIHNAKRKHQQISPLTIGIAGSFGKTSTKTFVTALLQPDYCANATPKSYNTLLGVAKTINTQLDSSCKAFVVEMDSYAKGEISKIARLVRPSIGCITAIGPQHLERFSSLDEIATAHSELIDALPPTGTVVINLDDAYHEYFLERAGTRKTVRVGIANSTSADLVARDIVSSKGGLSFVISDLRSNQSVSCATTLLGEHNVINILMASACALSLGIPLSALPPRIRTLEAVPHRLQPIRNNGMTIIDDSYNSNPAGAKSALNVLREFVPGRRILVTPGLVEMGPLEDSLNEAVGRQASQSCDVAILVGFQRTTPIKRGLMEEGFPEDRIYVVESLTMASSILQREARPGDTILFMNDLPDTYSEYW